MKTLAISFILLVCLLLSTFGQHLNLSLYDGNGINLLDVQKSTGIALTDWNTYSNEIMIEGLYQLESGFIIGGELGAHRLYYWEYKDYIYNYYHWGTLWTHNIGAIVGYSVNNFTLKTGLDLCSYADGSGTAVGFLFAADYGISLGKRLAIPIGFRTDFISATAFTTSPQIYLGLRYNFPEKQ